jgi:hypothetical protein
MLRITRMVCGRLGGRRWRSGAGLAAMLAAAVTFLVPGLAAAKPLYKTGTYKGTTSQGRPLTIGADRYHLRGVDTFVYAFCLFPDRGIHELHRVRSTKLIRISHGAFSVSDVPLLEGGTATIDGKLSAARTSGRMSVHYTETEYTSEGYKLGSCRGQFTDDQ